MEAFGWIFELADLVCFVDEIPERSVQNCGICSSRAGHGREFTRNLFIPWINAITSSGNAIWSRKPAYPNCSRFAGNVGSSGSVPLRRRNIVYLSFGCDGWEAKVKRLFVEEVYGLGE